MVHGCSESASFKGVRSSSRQAAMRLADPMGDGCIGKVALYGAKTAHDVLLTLVENE